MALFIVSRSNFPSLHTNRTLIEFNEHAYTGEERNRICASVVKYVVRGEDIFAFEMVPTDPLNLQGSEMVLAAFNFVQAKMPFCRLRLRATSHAQLANIALPAHPLHSISQLDTGELWDSISYAPVVRGGASGTVRIIGGSHPGYAIGDLTLSDIVVFADGIPNDIPPVAAVFLTDPMPPLCHVALLCQNRRTPCCYVRKSDLPSLALHSSKLMSLQFDLEKFVIKPATAERLVWRAPTASSSGLKLSQPQRKPSAPFSLDGWVEKSNSVSIVGAKALQCHRLDTVVGQVEFKKKSFVVPMGAYMSHIDDSGVAAAISALLKKWQSVPLAKCPSPST